MHTKTQKGRVTINDFYRYRLFTRHGKFNVLHRGGRLFQQWCVDIYAKMLQFKMKWPRKKQDTIRADLYRGLDEQISDADANIQLTGKKVILPSSFAYTPRWYDQNTVMPCTL